MEAVTQLALLPNEPPIHWLMLSPSVWHEWQSPDTVNRETENVVFKRIQKQAQVYSLPTMVSLTPKHRAVHRMEIEIMQSHPHYNSHDVENAIAEHMHMTSKKVKAILIDISVFYRLITDAGLEDWLEAA